MNKNNVIYPDIEWPYRLLANGIIIAIIAFFSFITLMIKTDFVGTKLDDIRQDFYALTSDMGFNLEQLNINGNIRTPQQEILNTLNLTQKNNILEINLKDIKTKLEELPWVQKTSIRRSFFPNIIKIKIEEKSVKALWQISEKLYPIDEEGNIIEAPYEPTHPMLLIIGNNAPQHINALMNILKIDDELFKRIKVANFISNRRWNLILDDIKDGIIIKLPENDIETAWKKFIKINASEGILKRKLTVIDLRFKDKVIVKLKKANDDEKIELKKVLTRKI